MSAYIVDASVLIQAYVQEPDTARIQTLIARLGEYEPDIIHVPEFCLLECTNILWKHVRFHNMLVATAQEAIEAMGALPLHVHPVIELLPRALSIGLEQRIAIYDSLYIALAEMLDHPLITADARQSDAAQSAGVSLKPLDDFSPHHEQNAP